MPVTFGTPLVRGSAYLPFVEFMEEIGAPVERVLEKALIPALVHKDPEALVPVQLAHSFLDKSARAVGSPDFGFAVGEHARIESLGAFGRSLRRSLTLHDALGKLHSKFPLYSSAERIWWSRTGNDVQIFHAYTCETAAGSRYAQQCALLLLRDLVRLAAGPSWQPGEVLSPNPVLDLGPVRKVFDGARLRQSEFTGIVFPAEILNRPMRWFWSGNEWGDKHDQTAFERSSPAGDFAGSIKQVISALMNRGRCQLSDVAEAVGLHPRTLQRYLSESEEEYSDLLAEVRFETALRLMSDPSVRVIDVAYELGYSDPANFTRAFRHWTGLKPSEFRRSQAPQKKSGSRAKPGYS
ncbi:Helix-turn-helix domain-containing protein [Rhizobium mongolense subsp. loessense]|uniref:Helix-turn-helix domain-containing protein n=1 Tax=Rhizobium mongolense subsp. loessense TaxID=158890 RepID=A0A1G4RXW2_9HYPH|nr:AraC family transcriptional regulator [Rhizobium mongolense]SCW61586.1 Helix-turn-helix domain-containing protein [Rhizobium mongolense subsp. loessense]